MKMPTRTYKVTHFDYSAKFKAPQHKVDRPMSQTSKALMVLLVFSAIYFLRGIFK